MGRRGTGMRPPEQTQRGWGGERSLESRRILRQPPILLCHQVILNLGILLVAQIFIKTLCVVPWKSTFESN